MPEQQKCELVQGLVYCALAQIMLVTNDPRHAPRQNHVSNNNPVRITFLLKIGVFWVVTPCGSCKNRRFGGTWRLLHQGDKNR
jgi:hypothetical protein